MNTLAKKYIFLLSALTIASLSACGGGGGGSDIPSIGGGGAGAVAPEPVVQTAYTQDTTNTTAKLGLLLIQAATNQVALEQIFFGSLLQSFANSSTSGSTPTAIFTCVSANGGSGSFSSAATKAGTYPGLKAGDSLSITFTNCNFANSPLSFNGIAVIRPSEAYATVSPLPDNFKVQYQLNTTDFAFTLGGVKYRSNGNQSVIYDATSAGGTLPEINVTAGLPNYTRSRFVPYNAVLPTVTENLASGGKIYLKLSAGDRFIAGIDGDINVTAATLETQSFTLGTTTRLAGSIATGPAVPDSGVLRTKNNTLNLQTVTSILGLNATVQADTDRNGSLDSTNTVSVSSLLN